jgi:hypothetical protein
LTKPLASSSAKRRAIVVEDESTRFLISENRIGAGSQFMTYNMLSIFDFESIARR